ncbi:hypothetical protein JI664_08480 [Rhodobacter sp. NTK016B]|uniref:RNA polymerase factor sigma-54 n=1 Tax=Rhodobacter sp. NTK016B TaxID=2759676 RepID=UPI001A8C8214|nr:hypothetical protein [Rhodobacter sp. NTK016B]MBN8291995.1 hypothetical protein [Rhodobacter sp. NTK016B]
MALNSRLELRTQQRLALTPELRTRLSVLRMTPAELDEALAAEAARNPFLKRNATSTVGPATGLGPLDWIAAREAPFQDDLRRQIERKALNPQVRAMALYLITELDADGFLEVDLDELAAELDLSADPLVRALEVLQSCEPVGIGARSVSESLALQLAAKGMARTDAQATVALLSDFARLNWPAIQSALGIGLAEARARAALLRTLSPRPLANGETARAAPLVADLHVSRDDSGRIAVVPAHTARHSVGLDETLVHKAEAEGFAPELLARARAMLAAIDQRGLTLARIGEWLLEKQAGFFERGLDALAPATRLDLAADLGLHPSTISRALAGKAIDVDGRLWPLSTFFSAALPGKDGLLSARAVQRRVAEMIAAEPESRPLSDERVAGLLRAQGVDIARRTVAKYRQGLHIPSSAMRRRLAADRRRE